MKKLCLSFIVAFSLISAVSSFAATKPSQSVLASYYSSKHPNAALAAKAKSPLYTSITVYNNSRGTIQVVVPNSPINDTVYPNDKDIINNPSYSGDTYLMLYDQYGNNFFGENVCHYARIYVEGYPGATHVQYIDSSSC